MQRSGKSGYIILFCFTLVYFLLNPAESRAQLLEKIMPNLEKAFVTGDHRQITKQHNKLKGKVKKKILSVQDSIEYLYAESRVHRLKGNLRNAEELAAAYVNKAETKIGENSGVFLQCLLRRATVSLEAGDFIPCRRAVNRFFATQQKFASADSEQVFRARFIQVKCALESGSTGEAYSLIDKLLFKAENRLEERKEENDGSGRLKFKRLSFKDKERRNHELLMVKVVKARILRERGELKESFEVLKELKKFIEDSEIRPEDQAFMEFQFEMGRYFAATGDRENSIWHLKEALSWFSRRDYEYTYTKTHEQYLNMLETLILTYIADEDQNRARDYAREYREILDAKFPETPSYNLRRKIPLDEKWDYRDSEKITELERLLREIEGYSLPFRYSGRILSYLKDAFLYNDSLEKAGYYLNRHVSFLKDKLGSNSVFYHEKNTELAEFYALHTTKIELAEPIFKESLHQGLVPQLSEYSDVYLRAWNRQGYYHQLRDKFQKSLNDYVHVLNILERRDGKNSTAAAAQSVRVADAEIQLGEFKDAEEKFLNALSILGKSGNSPDKMKCEEELARLYIVTGRYREAGKYLNRSLRTSTSKNVRNFMVSLGMDEEILLLMQKGLYSEAQEKAEEIIRVRTARLKTSKHRSMILPLQAAAQVYSANGLYGKAETHAIQACEISKAVFGDTSLHFFKSQAILARVHTSYGDYDRGLEFAKLAINGISRYYGNDHVEMAQPVTDIAMVLLYKGASKEDVLHYLTLAKNIVQKKLGDKHPKYAEALQYLASYHIQMNKMQDALPLLDQAEIIWKERLGKSSIYLAEILLSRADVDWKFGRIPDARKYLSEAAEMYRKNFNDVHPRYVAILPRIAQSYYLEKNNEKAIDYARDASKQCLAFVRSQFPSMSDREKSRFWSNLQPGIEFFYTLALKNYRNRPELISEMYDLVLQTKSILLSSSIRIRERIMNSANNEVKVLYRDWIYKKEQVSAAVEMGQDERTEAGIDLRKLETDADEMEAELSRISEDFRKSREESKLTWKQIKVALPARSAAVEMLRFRLYENGFTDSVIYAALILRQESEGGPALVVLPNGRQMESRNLRYYRNSIKSATRDNLSYGIYWAPVKAVLNNTSRIFFSPDGIYNELNPEGLLSPAGTYVIDEDKFTLIATSRDIMEEGKIKVRPQGQKNLAVLIGDPEYYPDSSKGEKLIEKLPGTRREIEEISTTLSSNRWDVVSLVDSNASESRIRAIGNPRILHIATHGFFKENGSSRFTETSFSLLSRNRAIDNPLLRSGIYLHSAGNTLDELKGDHHFQLGEGIMSAMEAMNLTLNASELVVLSACETGRGDIQSGEGVYGLQRAFQIAGAKGIIMSLFKVSDDATRELMAVFYKNWIERGLTIRDAFYQAKLEVKKTRPEPLFWSSFVLVGGG